MMHKKLVIVVVILSLAVHAQTQYTVQADSAVQLTTQRDSTAVDSLADTLTTQPMVQTDSIGVMKKTDSLSLGPKPQEPVVEKTEKIDVVRHDFKYRHQVGTALGMMAFITIILASVQSWNPN